MLLDSIHVVLDADCPQCQCGAGRVGQNGDWGPIRRIGGLFLYLASSLSMVVTVDTLGIRLCIDFANFYQIAQSTSGTESYSEGFTLIASYYIR